MSSTFEQWQQVHKQRAALAYQIATAAAAGLPPRQDDIDKFKAAETRMRELEAKFSEES